MWYLAIVDVMWSCNVKLVTAWSTQVCPAMAVMSHLQMPLYETTTTFGPRLHWVAFFAASYLLSAETSQ